MLLRPVAVDRGPAVTGPTPVSTVLDRFGVATPWADGLWRCAAAQPEDAVEWRKSGTRLRHIR